MLLQWKLLFCIYFYIWFEGSFVVSQSSSTNGPEQAPHPCLIREVQNHMLHRIEETGWKDFLQLTKQHRGQFSICSTTV